MEKVKVAEIATEYSMKPAVVVGELKKLGVFVTVQSSVDKSIVERVRRRLQSMGEAETDVGKKPAKPKVKDKGSKTAAKKPRRAAVKKPAVAKKAVKKVAKAATQTATIAAVRKVRKAATPKTEQVEAAAKKAKRLAPRRVPKVKKPEVEVVVPVPEEDLVLSKAAEEAAVPVEVTETPEPEMVAAAPEPEKVAAAEKEPPKKPAKEPVKVEKKTIAERVAESKPSGSRIQPKILKRTAATGGPASPTSPIKMFKPAPSHRPMGRRPSPARRFDRRKKGRSSQKVRPAAQTPVQEAPRRPLSPDEYRPVQLMEGLTVKELSEKLEIKSKEVIKTLLQKGVMATINQRLEGEIINEICAQYGFKPELHTIEEELIALEDEGERPEDYGPRPPVVTIMGHVDHGKTSLLDAIRETTVSEHEAGGITQHIGAYKVKIKNRHIVFLDTPGHEAFTMMRARGTQVTDIVVLVVAADDGVMPQTLEAIHHAEAAGVPMIVAINKIDKPEAQPDRIRQSLSEQGLTPEEWGGDTVMVDVSAKKKQNLDLLLEMILLVSDLKELKGNPNRTALGAVLEAKLDKGRGPVATVLVQNGTLRVGDTFIAGAIYGKVRAMFGDRGESVREAAPSTPVEVLGLQSLPLAGDSFHVIEDTTKAKQIGIYRQAQIREHSLQRSSRLSLDHLYEMLKQGEVKELPLVVKADVQGSVEVMCETLNKLSNERVGIRLIHSGAGAISGSDVLLASASNAIIIGFNVRPDRTVQEMADREGVDIRLHTVIYNISNEIKSAMSGLLEATTQEKHLGTAQVRNVFKIPKTGTIAGCYVTDGIITRNALVRLLRDNAVVHEGRIDSLKRFKEDASEIRSGFECGMRLERYSDVKLGDVIEAYVIEKVNPEPLFETAGRKS